MTPRIVHDAKDRGKIDPEAARKALDSVIWAPLRRDESIVDRYRYYRDMEDGEPDVNAS